VCGAGSMDWGAGSGNIGIFLNDWKKNYEKVDESQKKWRKLL